MKTSLCLASTLLAIVPVSYLYAQGDLTPPGPPGPTMKTLSELSSQIDDNATTLAIIDQAKEKRTPISGQIAINAAGSYYLTGKITGSSGSTAAIYINASNVTVDLNGFSVTTTAANLPGIAGSGDNIVVRNGIVHDCAGRGINLSSSSNVRIERVTSASNSHSGGIYVGDNAVLVDCVASNNADLGISTGTNSTVMRCTARGNVNTGIAVDSGSTISNCSASENGGGFSLALGSSIHNSAAYLNKGTGIGAFSPGGLGVTIASCVVRQNAGNGIIAYDAGRIEQCTVSENDNDGILVVNNCLVLNNTCEGNGALAGVTNGAGIHSGLNGRGNRIEGNNVINNDIGVRCEADGNLIIKNSSRGGTSAYTIAAGNSEGPEVNVYNPNATTTITNTNPWANFLY